MSIFGKRAVSLAAAITFGTAQISVCAYAEEERPDFNVKVEAPPQIIFMGDSIITGCGLEGYDENDNSHCDSFANMLAEKYRGMLPEDAEFEMFNEGLDGRTSEALLEYIRSGALDEELAKADAVVVSIGGNDLLGSLIVGLLGGGLTKIIERAKTLSKDLDTALDGFEKNMAEISEELHKRTEGEIIVQTLYDPLQELDIKTIANMSEKKIGRLNEIIKECSDGGKNYTVCDVAPSFDGKAEELTNIKEIDIHPNAEGHKLISELLDKTITSKTYTYYDYEAERLYEEEQARLAAEAAAAAEAESKEQERLENERAKRNSLLAGAGIGAGAVIVCGAAVFTVTRRKKKN